MLLHTIVATNKYYTIVYNCMAYIYTVIGKEKLYCGEEGDICFFCNRSLNGKDCLLETDFLICFENCQRDLE